MISYQFENALTIDLENLVAVDNIQWIDASANNNPEWGHGVYCYEMVFKFADKKVMRYMRHADKEKLISEREQLIEDWKNGTSKCLVVHQK